MYSSNDTEYCTPLSEHVIIVMEQDEDLKQMHNKRHKKQGGGNVSNESVGSHLDEEVIGIITMEDVMEELLQVPSNYSMKPSLICKCLS